VSDARVTIVVATWNRPDALRAAVRSAIRQTLADWRMLVIGDGCDARTGAVLDALGDSRIAYVNLPVRCGEQAGPNSIGMALADTPLIALLNHDDVWLPDHLARARAALDGDADLYIGRAARSNETAETPAGVVPVFTKRTPPRLLLRHAFSDTERAFEPCSAWVFRAELAGRVGPWRSAREIYRTPAEDWLLRAWRRGARMHFDPVITVLHLYTHYRRGSPHGNYATDSPEHATLSSMLERTPLQEFRAELERTTPTRKRSPAAHALRKPLRGALVNPLTGGIYRWTGLDAHTLYCRASGKPRGHVLLGASRRRTGRELPPPPDRGVLLAEARRLLAGRGT
jgi:GT2 family glycosyltransferase